MILTRRKFKTWMKIMVPKLSNRGGPVWSVETNQCRPRWFVKAKPVGLCASQSLYWDWCNQNMKGKLLCYWSNSEQQEEWWGFTNQSDIVFWTLGWQ